MTESTTANSASRDDASAQLRAALAGDEAAREWLADWLGPLMTAWAGYQLRRGRVPGVHADDLVQDVWIRLLPELATLRPRADVPDRMTPAVLALARRILVNRVVDLRRQASRRRLERLESSGPTRPETPVAPVTGPLTKQLRSERRRALEHALDLLAPRDRELYLRRIFEQTPIDRLAAEFGISPAGVIKARQRARVSLARHLSQRLLDDIEDG